MIKSVALLGLVAFYLIGSISADPEKVEHGNRGAFHNQAYDYEALFGTTDHDDLVDLPADKRRTRLINLAKSHDTNKNGIIEKEELVEWIIHSFKMLEHQETELARKDDDPNGDGKIYFAEILNRQYGFNYKEIDAFETTGNSGREGDSEAFDEMIKDDQARFAAADANHDGFMDSVEYVAYAMPYDHPHMHDVMIEKTLKELDTNNDKAIHMEEFIESLSGKNDEFRRFEITQFELLDKNRDGKLTKEELRPWALLKDNKRAKDEADHLVNECDEDKDGHLSIDEIIKKEEDFFGSHATDYGKNLHYIKDEL